MGRGKGKHNRSNEFKPGEPTDDIANTSGLSAGSSPTETTGDEPEAQRPEVEAAVEGVETESEERERWAKAAERREARKQSLTDLGALGEQKLVAPTREGYYRRWANDDGNRLATLQNKGYDFVRKGSIGSENVISDDPGDKISQLVGMTKTNQPMRAYLMEIPEGWRNEDQQQKEDRRRSVEQDIRRTTHGGGQSRSSDGSSVMYTPDRGPSHFDA